MEFSKLFIALSISQVFFPCKVSIQAAYLQLMTMMFKSITKPWNNSLSLHQILQHANHKNDGLTSLLLASCNRLKSQKKFHVYLFGLQMTLRHTRCKMRQL
ncbi:hypothetical protein GQ457_16G010790 [Hibiscus cannabinus]